MSTDVYRKLADTLDTLPNGFPATADGLEITLLKKIFTPDEAELFCDLRLTFETPEQIAERTGRPLTGLAERLTAMWKRGQLFGVDFGEVVVFKMVPWVFGIYEFQLDRMDQEFARLAEAYNEHFGPQFFKGKPQLMQVLPVEQTLTEKHDPLPYQQVSAIINTGKSFGLGECICKKEQKLLGKGCEAPLEICMGIAPVPGFFDGHQTFRPISKKEAFETLERAEAAGLVHMTSNIKSGHYYICNCCGCCCGVLRSINEWGLNEATNSHYYARIDQESCIQCGVCRDERCQVQAVAEIDQTFEIDPGRCIGCGLCISTCPSESIALVHRQPDEFTPVPADEQAWFEARGRSRGVDFSQFQ